MTSKSKKKRKNEENLNVEQFMDYRAILYAEMATDDETWKKTWHLCRCARCKQQMSISQASWDDNYSPIHKVCPNIQGE